MATAVAVGTLLSSGASAAAGAGLIGSTVAGVSLSSIASGFSLAGMTQSFFAGQAAADAAYDASLAQSRAELDAARARFGETELRGQREKTQAAIEEAERQRRLRRSLATQRANFAGGVADINSGSATVIEERIAGEINRESRLAQLASQSTVSAFERQGLGELSIGAGRASQAIGAGETARARADATGFSQLASIGKFGASLIKLGKKDKKDS